MAELVVTTYDWVPEPPRGFVRDIRVRWALEEAGLPYRMQAVPFENRGPDFFAHQPFGQVPWLIDGDVSIFESGAILLYLGERSPALLPADPRARLEAIQWSVAALNSVEMAVLPWVLLLFSGATAEARAKLPFDGFVDLRMQRMEGVLAGREWLAGPFTIADILMADALRLAGRYEGLAKFPACRDYVARATARPAFVKAHADQLAHFAAADRVRAARG